MKRAFISGMFVIFCVVVLQAQQKDSILNDLKPANNTVSVQNEPEFIQSSYLNHSEDNFSQKFWRSFGRSVELDVTMMTLLAILPDNFTMWRPDKFKLSVIGAQYKRSYTQPPVFDHDLFIINYVGHPYEGAFFYNTMRSQGGTIWQSAAVSLCQSVLWEYVWEGGMEQPSIQDLIVTPVLGSVIGELSFRATMNMRKGGFLWYEKVLTCIINPSYVINNGFQTTHKH